MLATKNPTWCSFTGPDCGGTHTTNPDAIPIAGNPHDEVLVGAETGPDTFIRLEVPTGGPPVEVQFTPAAALALAIALVEQVRTVTTPTVWGTRGGEPAALPPSRPTPAVQLLKEAA
jgi:hypothetical protein